MGGLRMMAVARLVQPHEVVLSPVLERAWRTVLGLLLLAPSDVPARMALASRRLIVEMDESDRQDHLLAVLIGPYIAERRELYIVLAAICYAVHGPSDACLREFYGSRASLDERLTRRKRKDRA